MQCQHTNEKALKPCTLLSEFRFGGHLGGLLPFAGRGFRHCDKCREESITKDKEIGTASFTRQATKF